MIRYRRPKQDDPVIHDLICKELVPLSHLSPSELKTVVKDVPKRLSHGVTLVASKDYESDPIAFIHFMMHGELLYIDMMAVAPSYRRNRLGKTLLAHAENFASSRGCVKSKVMVDFDNTRAHLFYKNLGYQTIRYMKPSQCFELEKELLNRR